MAGEAHDYSDRVLHAPPERCRLFTELVLQHIDRTTPLRVLDLGCGTGEQLFDLARVLPRAILTGVDISAASIRAAESARARRGLDGRIIFETADFMKYRGSGFDLILSWGVLHLIPAATEALFAKITFDLARGGLLVATMPYRCLHNAVLGGVRRSLRAVRGSLVDTMILALLQGLHGRDFSDDFLRERIPYMYRPARHQESRQLCRWLDQSCGLEIVAQHPEIRPSRFQYRYRTTIFRRR